MAAVLSQRLPLICTRMDWDLCAVRQKQLQPFVRLSTAVQNQNIQLNVEEKYILILPF